MTRRSAFSRSAMATRSRKNIQPTFVRWWNRPGTSAPIRKCRSSEASGTRWKPLPTAFGSQRRSWAPSPALAAISSFSMIRKRPSTRSQTPRRNTLNHWFSNTLVSRLDSKETGAIIIVMQRVHMDDLCGYVTELSDGWTVLSLPAIAEVEEQIQIGPKNFYARRVRRGVCILSMSRLRPSKRSDKS